MKTQTMKSFGRSVARVWFVLVLPVAVLAENTPGPDRAHGAIPYNTLGAGYFWSNRPDEGIDGLAGYAVELSTVPMSRLVIKLGHEQVFAGLSGDLEPFDITGSATTLTVGTWFPLAPDWHLTLDVGFDYEASEIVGPGLAEADSDIFANVVAGLTYKPAPRWEIGARLQRLQATNSGVSSNWVSGVSAAYSVANRIDLIVSVGYEEDTPHYVAGLRWRY